MPVSSFYLLSSISKYYLMELLCCLYFLRTQDISTTEVPIAMKFCIHSGRSIGMSSIVFHENRGYFKGYIRSAPWTVTAKFVILLSVWEKTVNYICLLLKNEISFSICTGINTEEKISDCIIWKYSSLDTPSGTTADAYTSDTQFYGYCRYWYYFFRRLQIGFLI